MQIMRNLFSKETEAQIKQIFASEKRVGFQSKLESYKNMSKTETQIKVFGNGLGLILALLTLMNYFNMMTASVQERSREFAVLESLGMTQKQIRRVLMTEGLGYGVISVLLSLLAGVPLGYVIFIYEHLRYDVLRSCPKKSPALYDSLWNLCSDSTTAL